MLNIIEDDTTCTSLPDVDLAEVEDLLWGCAFRGLEQGMNFSVDPGRCWSKDMETKAWTFLRIWIDPAPEGDSCGQNMVNQFKTIMNHPFEYLWHIWHVPASLLRPSAGGRWRWSSTWLDCIGGSTGPVEGQLVSSFPRKSRGKMFMLLFYVTVDDLGRG